MAVTAGFALHRPLNEKYGEINVNKTLTTAIAAAFVGLAGVASAATVTIATINNPDMIELQKLSKTFEQANPDIQLRWVTLEENVLRQRVTTDIATGSGQFDLMTIGAYEAPIWAGKKLAEPVGSARQL